MTEQENILRLASEAGFGNYAYEAASMFERFAALVKADAVAETREACAKVCRSKAMQMENEANNPDCDQDDRVSLRSTAWILSNCAASISAMSATPSRDGQS